MEGRSGYESVIGMEVHVELQTKSKMFCACPADHFGKQGNSQTCPVCLGLPGALPVPNKEAIRQAQLIGAALGCTLNEFSKFDRKNYFYPDLPKGYQISQYDLPLCSGGKMKFVVASGEEKIVRVRRVHMEEDTAKMVHRGETSLVDFNRSGVPLVEIVSEPDLRTSDEVREYLKAIVRLVRHLGVSSCDMEKGTLRLEANVSVRRVGDVKLPSYKVEIKNVNSFRFIAIAIDYEKKRQEEELGRGIFPIQETRGFDDRRGVTVSQRGKEEAKDYRYFPEPDIPPLRFSENYLIEVKRGVGELPEVVAVRLREQYELSDSYIAVLTKSPETLKAFEQLVAVGESRGVEAIEVANAIVNKRVDLSLTADEIIARMVKTTQVAVKDQDFSNEISEVIERNSGLVSEFKKGKEGVIEFLVGQLMRELRGRVDPAVLRGALEKKLKES